MIKHIIIINVCHIYLSWHLSLLKRLLFFAKFGLTLEALLTNINKQMKWPQNCKTLVNSEINGLPQDHNTQLQWQVNWHKSIYSTNQQYIQNSKQIIHKIDIIYSTKRNFQSLTNNIWTLYIWKKYITNQLSKWCYSKQLLRF